MKVSLITSSLNEERNLERCLQMVEAQTYPDIEHIIVDGMSTDGTDAILARHKGLTIIKREPNGVYDALNVGIHQSTGDLVGIIHANDRLAAPDVIARIVAAFEADKDLDFVYGDMQYVHPVNYQPRRIYQASRFSPDQLAGGMAPPHPTLYLRRSVAEKIGDYRLDFPRSSDFEMWIRLFSDKSLKYRYLPFIIAEMTLGGYSTQWKSRLFLNNWEKFRALRLHNITHNPLRLAVKYWWVVKYLFKKPNYD